MGFERLHKLGHLTPFVVLPVLSHRNGVMDLEFWLSPQRDNAGRPVYCLDTIRVREHNSAFPLPPSAADIEPTKSFREM
jgi:hypothetical protein